MLDHLQKLFIVANYCDLEKELRFKLATFKRELERREKALSDFKNNAFHSWLNEDRENNYSLLVSRASCDDDHQSACDLLPYQKSDEYLFQLAKYEKGIQEIKEKMFPIFEEYQAFINSPSGSLAARINTNAYKRMKKLEGRIEHMFALKRRVFFLTFTFNDNALAKHSEKTLKKAVLAYVRKNCDYYVVNKDFGSQNARLHFHAIVVSKNNKIDGKLWQEKYGFMLYRVCGKRKRDQQNIKLYVTKLARHTVKETTAKDERLIYSRAFALNGV